MENLDVSDVLLMVGAGCGQGEEDTSSHIHRHHIVSGHTLPTRLITDVADLDHLAERVPVLHLHCNLPPPTWSFPVDHKTQSSLLSGKPTLPPPGWGWWIAI